MSLSYTRIRYKEKILGVTLLILSVVSLIILMYLFKLNLISFFILVSILIFSSPILMLMFNIGIKLILYNPERAITISELKKRVYYLVKKGSSKAFIKPMFIYICGIDGAGKTTQVKYIAKKLKHASLKYKYVSLRWAAFISYPFLFMCKIMGYTKWYFIKSRSLRYVEHYFFKNKVIASLWSWLFTLDMFFYSLLKIHFPLKRGFFVLSDRFVLDAIVDLIVETKIQDIHSTLVGRFLLSLLPKNSIIILLDLNEKDAFKRKSDIPNVSYLSKRRNLYIKLAKLFGIPIINSMSTKERVHKEIVQRILSHYVFWYFKK